MHGTLRWLFSFFLHLGTSGLFVLGILDSSFLFMPLGNDLLITALTLRHHVRLPLYVAAAALGSCVGVWILDAISRKGGEVGLEKMMSRRRFNFLRKKMESHAGVPVALASLAPPPFPFTAVIATASAFHYPRLKLFAIVFSCRLVRFTAVGLLAIAFGRQILSFAKTNTFVGIMIALIVVSVIGSAFSILRWVRQSRKVTAR